MPNDTQKRNRNPLSDETKNKIRMRLLGRKISLEQRALLSQIKKGKPSNAKGKHWKIASDKRVNMSRGIGEDCHLWKGDDVKYSGIHMWVRKLLGVPQWCEHCGSTNRPLKQYHWANISGEYKRLIEDWMRLCVKCHSHHDHKRYE